MDRRARTVIDPKVRQVGFVTPGADGVNKGGTSEAQTAPIVGPGKPVENLAHSLSPVIIPPSSRNLQDLTHTHGLLSPMQVSSPRRLASPDVAASQHGSYNPSEFILGSLSTPSTPTAKKSPRNNAPDDKADKATPSDKAPKPLKEKTTRAERKAIQEAQRAAKAAKAGGGVAPPKTEAAGPSVSQKEKEVKAAKPPKELGHRKSTSADQVKDGDSSAKGQDKKKKKDVPAPRRQFDDEQQVANFKKRALVAQTETKNRVELFRHLPQFVHSTMLASLEAKFFKDEGSHPHPAIYKVGLQYVTGDVVGGNARCIVMLMAFREMIEDYTTPPEKLLARDLTAKINSQVSFLTTCRPLAVSMGNAIKFLKMRIGLLAPSLSEAQGKAALIGEIDRFIQEKILFAGKEIVRHAVEKIRDGDICLTYGSPSVVEMIFLRAHELGKKFRVVVVDSRPKMEGKKLLKRLLLRGIDCTYAYINAVSYIMQGVTRVFLGAASVLSNGTVYSRVGTASVAMVAHAFSIPVMICCETYKFHERVQLDSITANELGDPNVLVKVDGRSDAKELTTWEDDSHLQLLNLIYDATPSDYVFMIITELGMVPPTSVPVILREYRRDPSV